MRYGALHADPPWHWQSRSAKGEGRSAKNHYGILSLAELMGMRPQIDAWAAPDCCLFLWSLNSMRQQSLDLIAAWGFEFKTVGFTWAKRTPSDTAWHFGLGYWTRQNSEQCLLAVRGRPRRLHADVPELIVAPRREHSRKPGEVYGAIERLVAGPYLDLFSRADRPGWDAWGDEAGMWTDTDPALVTGIPSSPSWEAAG